MLFLGPFPVLPPSFVQSIFCVILLTKQQTGENMTSSAEVIKGVKLKLTQQQDLSECVFFVLFFYTVLVPLQHNE